VAGLSAALRSVEAERDTLRTERDILRAALGRLEGEQKGKR